MKRPLLTNLTDFPFDYVTPPELATYLDCDRRTIVGMLESKALYGYRVGRNWRIPLDTARRAFPEQRRRHA